MNVKMKYFQELSFQPQTLVHSFSWISASQTCDLCSWAWMCSYIFFEEFIWLQATVLISQELPGLCSWELWFQIQRSCVHTNTPQLGKFTHWYSWLCASFLNGLCSVQLNLNSGLEFWVAAECICTTVTCLNIWWKKSVLTCFIENKSVCSFTLQYNLFGFK